MHCIYSLSSLKAGLNCLHLCVNWVFCGRVLIGCVAVDQCSVERLLQVGPLNLTAVHVPIWLNTSGAAIFFSFFIISHIFDSWNEAIILHAEEGKRALRQRQKLEKKKERTRQPEKRERSKKKLHAKTAEKLWKEINSMVMSCVLHGGMQVFPCANQNGFSGLHPRLCTLCTQASWDLWDRSAIW